MNYTVWEIMGKLDPDQPFHIITDLGQITGDTPVSKRDVMRGYEERKNILDALGYEVDTVDLTKGIIYTW